MGRLIINVQMSLDGVMQGPGGPEEDTSGGFQQGGWAMPLLRRVDGGSLLLGDGLHRGAGPRSPHLRYLRRVLAPTRVTTLLSPAS
jgi:hypothetical protein